ncbi:hypothetical protein HK097_008459 [Rhizophlyctis rosea]|uniref:Uncharacterized protein n=1 Tax=Rhizophlyctis rosea TaxID=64517 RepID=A0AAD5SLL0_9FUNG|nr:hypothetical protein HK097_008459 [Rhizophlyctis rosea]
MSISASVPPPPLSESVYKTGVPNPLIRTATSPPLRSNVAEFMAANPALGHRARGLQRVLDDLERPMPKAGFGGFGGQRMLEVSNSGTGGPLDPRSVERVVCMEGPEAERPNSRCGETAESAQKAHLDDQNHMSDDTGMRKHSWIRAKRCLTLLTLSFLLTCIVVAIAVPLAIRQKQTSILPPIDNENNSVKDPNFLIAPTPVLPYKLLSLRVYNQFPNGSSDFYLSADGKSLFVCGPQTGSSQFIAQYNVSSGTLMRRLPNVGTTKIQTVRRGRNAGLQLLSSSVYSGEGQPLNASIDLWNITSGRILKSARVGMVETDNGISSDGAFAFSNLSDGFGFRILNFTATPPVVVRSVTIDSSWVTFHSYDMAEVTLDGGRSEYWLATIVHFLDGKGPHLTVENAITAEVLLQKELWGDLAFARFSPNGKHLVVMDKKEVTIFSCGTTVSSEGNNSTSGIRLHHTIGLTNQLIWNIRSAHAEIPANETLPSPSALPTPSAGRITVTESFLYLAINLEGTYLVTKWELVTGMYMGDVAYGDWIDDIDAVDGAGGAPGALAVGVRSSVGVLVLGVWDSEGILPSPSPVPTS